MPRHRIKMLYNPIPFVIPGDAFKSEVSGFNAVVGLSQLLFSILVIQPYFFFFKHRIRLSRIWDLIFGWASELVLLHQNIFKCKNSTHTRWRWSNYFNFQRYILNMFCKLIPGQSTIHFAIVIFRVGTVSAKLLTLF